MGLRALRAEAPEAIPCKSYKEAAQSPEEVARRTSELLGEQGWCRWQCDLLDGDVIVVVDERIVRNIPRGYPTYTVGELYLLLKMDEATIRLIHEAKKLGDAVIVEVVGRIPGKRGGEAMPRRSLYECSHARVSGDRILCRKGYRLSPGAADGGIGLRWLAMGRRLSLGVCRDCPDFDCMGPPVPREDRGWLDGRGGS